MAKDPNDLSDRDDNTIGAVPVTSGSRPFNYLWLLPLLLIPLLLLPFCSRHRTDDTAATAAPVPTAAATPDATATPAAIATNTASTAAAVINPFTLNPAGPDMGKAVLNFDVNDTVPNGAAITALNGVIAYLQATPAAKVTLKGYTDSTGTADENKRLTQGRINNVKSALTGAGVDAGRITAANFGEAYPVTDNASPQAREMNRRVEIELAK